MEGKEIEKIETTGGRKLWRHPSGMGTVIEFNDGQDRKVLVLDAQYRVRQMNFSSTGSHSASTLQNYDTYNTNVNWYINGVKSNTTPSACESVTDTTLNTIWVNSIDTNTSRQNTDVWVTFQDCGVAHHCRSITVDGIGCDIPNIQTLLRIFCEGNNLDMMDPTVADYPDLQLSNWFNSWYAWSSTKHSSGIRYMDFNGLAYFGYTSGFFSIIPVLEL